MRRPRTAGGGGGPCPRHRPGSRTPPYGRAGPRRGVRAVRFAALGREPGAVVGSGPSGTRATGRGRSGPRRRAGRWSARRPGPRTLPFRAGAGARRRDRRPPPTGRGRRSGRGARRGRAAKRARCSARSRPSTWRRDRGRRAAPGLVGVDAAAVRRGRARPGAGLLRAVPAAPARGPAPGGPAAGRHGRAPACRTGRRRAGRRGRPVREPRPTGRRRGRGPSPGRPQG